MKWYYIAVGICAVLTVLGKFLHTIIVFFFNMGKAVAATETKVDTILDNHLPHLDARIGKIETYILGEK